MREANAYIPAPFKLSAPIAWPHMLDVTLHSMKIHDESLAVLLAASPQLLRLILDDCELDSWNVMRMAALYCHQLRQLLVSGHVDEEAQPAVASPVASPLPPVFLPHLAVLSLCQYQSNTDSAGDCFLFSDLQPLIHTNNRSLHSIALSGSALTAAAILSLSVLPVLSHLAVSHRNVRVWLTPVVAAMREARCHRWTLAEVVAALRDARSHLWTSYSQQPSFDTGRYLSKTRAQPVRSASVDKVALLDVWEAEVAARRLSERVDEGSKHNLLGVEGIDSLVVRPVFFQALQAAVQRSPHGGTRVGLLQYIEPSDGDPWREEDEEDD